MNKIELSQAQLDEILKETKSTSKDDF